MHIVCQSRFLYITTDDFLVFDYLIKSPDVIDHLKACSSYFSATTLYYIRINSPRHYLY